MCYFLGHVQNKETRGNKETEKKKPDSEGLEQVRAPILLPQSLSEKHQTDTL